MSDLLTKHNTKVTEITGTRIAAYMKLMDHFHAGEIDEAVKVAAMMR